MLLFLLSFDCKKVRQTTSKMRWEWDDTYQIFWMELSKSWVSRILRLWFCWFNNAVGEVHSFVLIWVRSNSQWVEIESFVCLHLDLSLPLHPIYPLDLNFFVASLIILLYYFWSFGDSFVFSTQSVNLLIVSFFPAIFPIYFD